jgi:hypothetical protein
MRRTPGKVSIFGRALLDDEEYGHGSVDDQFISHGRLKELL